MIRTCLTLLIIVFIFVGIIPPAFAQENTTPNFTEQQLQKAEEIAKYITKNQAIKVDEFATLFAMTQEEAHTFLSFIKKGVDFKEEHIDK